MCITALETDTEKDSSHPLVSMQPVHPPDTPPWQEKERLCLFLTLVSHPPRFRLLTGSEDFELPHILHARTIGYSRATLQAVTRS